MRDVAGCWSLITERIASLTKDANKRSAMLKHCRATLKRCTPNEYREFRPISKGMLYNEIILS